jgi:hypothetical protein
MRFNKEKKKKRTLHHNKQAVSSLLFFFKYTMRNCHKSRSYTFASFRITRTNIEDNTIRIYLRVV